MTDMTARHIGAHFMRKLDEAASLRHQVNLAL